MRRKIFFITCGVLLCMISYSSAAQRTGNDIINACPYVFDTDSAASPEKLFAATDCFGYVAGLNDMAVLLFGITGKSLYCLPKKEGLEGGQVLRVFLKWLEEHPESLHESGRSLFVSAMGEAYPCE